MPELHIIIISVLSAFLSVFVVIAFVLLNKTRRLRHKLNVLLEENAAKTYELDSYMEQQKNPLGPLVNQSAKSLILSFDHTGKILKVNDEILRVLGFHKNDLIGKNMVGTILPKPEKEKYNVVTRIFANPKLFIEFETQAQKKDKTPVWISWTNRFTYDKQKHPIEATAVGFDISKRKNLEAELQYLSTVDPQTGVLNRTALLEVGARELKRAMRYKRALSVAVIKLKHQNRAEAFLDDFTDSVLRDVIQLCRKVMRSVDYLGRIGDIEFAIVLPETESTNLPFLVKRLNEHLDQYNKQSGLQGPIGLIYGVAGFKTDRDTIDSLITKADLDLQKKEKQSIRSTNSQTRRSRR